MGRKRRNLKRKPAPDPAKALAAMDLLELAYAGDQLEAEFWRAKEAGDDAAAWQAFGDQDRWRQERNARWVARLQSGKPFSRGDLIIWYRLEGRNTSQSLEDFAERCERYRQDTIAEQARPAVVVVPGPEVVQ